MDAVLFHDAAETEKFSVGHGELLLEVVDCWGGVDHALSSHVLGSGTPYELTDPRLRGEHPPLPGQRIPLRGHTDHHQAWMMLQRNLLYTAVTRAKKLVVLVGSKKAIGQAVRTVGAGLRYTTLNYRFGQR